MCCAYCVASSCCQKGIPATFGAPCMAGLCTYPTSATPTFVLHYVACAPVQISVVAASPQCATANTRPQACRDVNCQTLTRRPAAVHQTPACDTRQPTRDYSVLMVYHRYNNIGETSVTRLWMRWAVAVRKIWSHPSRTVRAFRAAVGVNSERQHI